LLHDPDRAGPPLEDPSPPSWPDELARQRALLDATATAANPEFEALRRWRDAAARAARINPETVLGDHVLRRVAAARPTDVVELGEIRGVGPILASRLGPQILEALDASTAGHDD
jgi:superfamily II DNA helicase RecQ